MPLHIAPGLVLPDEAVTETSALIAKRRVGKSNAAVVMAEAMYDAGLPWVAIDPKGDWWGVRSSADGKGPGLAVPIFGGEHGDVPLEARAGAYVADLVASERLTCVLDLSEFSKGDQIKFLVAFAERLLKVNRDPLHLFLEEADEYVPQRVSGDVARLVGAFSKLVRRGGFRGIGATLITQRSAVLNKDVLTQIETLYVLRTTAPLDVKAMREWVRSQGEAEEVVESLPSLELGEAWVWSPSFLGTMQRVRFPRRRTFDSGETPQVGKPRRAPARLADVDLASIKEAMAETIERAEADDPKVLRRQLAAARAERDKALADRPAPEPDVVEVSVLTDEDRQALDRAVATMTAGIERWQEGVASLALSVGDLVAKVDGAVQRHSAPRPAPAQARSAQRLPARPAPSVERVDVDGLGKQAVAMLEELARRHPVTLTEQQLSTLVGYSRRSSSWGPSLRQITAAGLVERPHGRWGELAITPAGLATAGVVEEAPQSPAGRLEMWASRLPAQAGAFLRHLAAVHPSTVTREELGEATGYSLTSSSFGPSLGQLVKLGLVETGDGWVIASDALVMP